MSSLFFIELWENQFSFVSQTVSKSYLIGVETPLLPIPPLKRNFSGLFYSDDLFIFTLIWPYTEHPPPHQELGRCPPLSVMELSLELGALASWSSFTVTPKKGVVFLQFRHWQPRSRAVRSSEVCVTNEPICWNCSDTFLQTKHKDYCVNIAFCSFFLRILLLKFRPV